MDRRRFLFSMAGGMTASALSAVGVAVGATKPRQSKLGIAGFSYHVRMRAERSGKIPAQVSDPLDLLRRCSKLGAGGMQCSLGKRDESYIRQLRRYAADHNLFIEGSASLPRDAGDVERFESHVLTAKNAGASVVRVAIGGRRYEQFDKLEQFRTFAARTWTSMQLAEPVVARHRMRLAIENHKDFRAPEMLKMLERLDSEYVGMCLDTGNSIALLEDPMDTVRTWVPWAHSVHVKDMALREYEDGFLLADVVLGKGLLGLPAIVAMIRKARPGIRFCLEMATRDPLKVPCLTERYWATLADVPGSDLARTLRYVRVNAGDEDALPRVSHLPLAEQVRLEEENIRKCLRYASAYLDL